MSGLLHPRQIDTDACDNVPPGDARLSAHVANFVKANGCGDRVLPRVDVDRFLRCVRLRSAFRFERFCYTLRSLTYLGSAARINLMDRSHGFPHAGNGRKGVAQTALKYDSQAVTALHLG